MKYKELLKLTDKLLDAIKAPFKIRAAEKKLESKIIDIEQSIAEKELEVQNAKGQDPINLDVIIDNIDKVDLEKRKLKQLQELQKELF